MQLIKVSHIFMMFPMSFYEWINQIKSCELHAHWNYILHMFFGQTNQKKQDMVDEITIRGK